MGGGLLEYKRPEVKQRSARLLCLLRLVLHDQFTASSSSSSSSSSSCTNLPVWASAVP